MLIPLLHANPQAQYPQPAFTQADYTVNGLNALTLQSTMQQRQLFALLDPIQHEFDIPGIAAQQSDEDGCCLYTGEAADIHGHYIPHIVRATPDTILQIKQKLWEDEGWGYLFISAAPLQKIRRHFKHWLTVSSPRYPELMFRLQDWRMIYTYSLASTRSELDALFGPIQQFIFASGLGPQISISRKKNSAYRLPIGQRHALSAEHETGFQHLQNAAMLIKVHHLQEESKAEKYLAMPSYMQQAMLWAGLYKATDLGFEGALDISRLISLMLLWDVDFNEHPTAADILNSQHNNIEKIDSLFQLAKQQLQSA